MTTSYYLLLKKYEQLGEVNEKDFIIIDDKKAALYAQEDKTKDQ